jgi:hypothetical protein
VGLSRPLPDRLSESSGVAWSLASDGSLFTHNDGGHEPTVYVLDRRGSVLARIPLLGAENRDWEDMATGTCARGACVYLADTGDNQEARDVITLYRFHDPGVYDGSPIRAEAFPMVLPDGPRDIEALFVLPGEEVFFISKGRNHSATVYRYPPPLKEGEKVRLESIQELSTGPLPLLDQITGADASRDGRFVAVRTYQTLRFYSWAGSEVQGGRLRPLEGGTVALRILAEGQGEAVGLGPGGEVALTSEAVFGRGGTLSFLECAIPGGSD